MNRVYKLTAARRAELTKQIMNITYVLLKNPNVYNKNQLVAKADRLRAERDEKILKSDSCCRKAEKCQMIGE